MRKLLVPSYKDNASGNLNPSEKYYDDVNSAKEDLNVAIEKRGKSGREEENKKGK